MGRHYTLFTDKFLVFLEMFVDFGQCLDDLAQRLVVLAPEYFCRATAVACLQPFDDERAKLVKLPVRLA